MGEANLSAGKPPTFLWLGCALAGRAGEETLSWEDLWEVGGWGCRARGVGGLVLLGLRVSAWSRNGMLLPFQWL